MVCENQIICQALKPLIQTATEPHQLPKKAHAWQDQSSDCLRVGNLHHNNHNILYMWIISSTVPELCHKSPGTSFAHAQSQWEFLFVWDARRCTWNIQASNAVGCVCFYVCVPCCQTNGAAPNTIKIACQQRLVVSFFIITTIICSISSRGRSRRPAVNLRRCNMYVIHIQIVFSSPPCYLICRNRQH